MPIVNTTNIILTDESAELKEILEKNFQAKDAYEQFEAEYKLRYDLANARRQQKITQKE